MRHPVFNEIKDKLPEEGNPRDLNYNEFAQCNDIVLAWGKKRFSQKENTKLFEKIKEHNSVYILNAEDETKITFAKYNKWQIRHPDNRAWTRLGSIENAKLQKVEDIKRYFNKNLDAILPTHTDLDA